MPRHPQNRLRAYAVRVRDSASGQPHAIHGQWTIIQAPDAPAARAHHAGFACHPHLWRVEVREGARRTGRGDPR